VPTIIPLARERRGLRERGFQIRRCGSFGMALQLRQPEVEQLRARLCDHDVAGFQVAVRHALPVRDAQRICDLGRDRERPLQW
jgi:hypothetical protein